MKNYCKGLFVIALLLILAGCSQTVDDGVYSVQFDQSSEETIHTSEHTEIVLPFVESETGFLLGWEDPDGTLFKETYTIKEDVILTPVFESFDAVLDLDFVDHNNDVKILNYNGDANHIKIPPTIDGYTVTSIGEEAFKNTKPHIVELPMNVNFVGSLAFADMPNLEEFHYYGEYIGSFEIVLSESEFTSYMEDYDACSVPDSETPTDTDPWLFDEACPIIQVTSIDGPVTGPDGSENYTYTAEIKNAYSPYMQFNQTLNVGVFEDSHKLRHITLPDKLMHIDGRAFYGLEYLECVDIKNNTFFYSEDGLLYEQDTDMLVYYPSRLLIADDVATGVFRIPEHITYIGYEAFQSERIRFVFVHEGAIFEDGAFASLVNLQNIAVEDTHETLTSIDGVVYSKDLTDLIVYPAGKRDETFTIGEETTIISTAAFFNQRHLERLIVSEGLVTIEEGAFINNYALRYVDLPRTLETIEDKNFISIFAPHEDPRDVVEPLETLILRNPDAVVSIGNYSPARKESTVIYVPDHMFDAYTRAGWQNFLSDLKPLSELE